jgi:hypothetical protein
MSVIREGLAQLPPASALAAAVEDDWTWNEAVAQVRRFALMEVTVVDGTLVVAGSHAAPLLELVDAPGSPSANTRERTEAVAL